MIPSRMIELDELDSQLREAAGHEAIRCKGPRGAGILPVELERVLGFGREIGHLGDGRLHFESHFILGDTGGDFGVIAESGMLFVERIEIDHDKHLSIRFCFQSEFPEIKEAASTCVNM